MKKCPVYLSPVAEYKLERLLEYLLSEWGKQAKINFLNDFQSSISQIESFPESCPKSELYNGLYKCIVTKLTSFYYRFANDEIEILTISDNRQHPDELLKEIRKLR